jgi:hypothetical protein
MTHRQSSLAIKNSAHLAMILLVSFAIGGSDAHTDTDAGEKDTLGPAPQANPAHLDGEHWEKVFITGSPAGFQRLEIHPIEHEGEPAYRFDILSEMKAVQFGTSIFVRVLGDAIMRPDGTPICVRETVQIGPDTHTFEGTLRGSVLQSTVNVDGTDQPHELVWPEDAIFMIGVPFSLWSAPMRPGETRRLQTFEYQQDMIRHQLRAKEFESVEIDGQELELLRIEDDMMIGQASMSSIYWTDEEGTVVKSSMGDFADSYRTTREEALAVASESAVDLGFGVSVPVARSLDPPHETQSVRYLVTLRGEDPSEIFPESDFQTVERIDEHSVFITVSAASTSLETDYVASSVEDLEPTQLISSDDPGVLRLAEELSRSETPPQTPVESFQAASDIAQLVHDKMHPAFGRGLVSAAEAAESLSGDCTEHALLTAAIARSIGLPARAAFGFVYVDQAFCFHMWTEIQIQGRWIPFDATLSSRGVGAAHIKLAHSSFSTQFPLNELLPTLRILGKIDLEIIDIGR